MGDGAAIGSRI